MISNLSYSLNDLVFSDKPSVTDAIHQIIINLNLNPPKETIQKLLEESISYLDNDLDLYTTSELFFLISTCLSLLPEQSDEFYNSVFENSQKNSNRLILFTKVFLLKKDKCSNPNIQDFYKDVINQIIIQIQEPKESFYIFNLEIKPKYLIDFIIDIVLMSELDENAVSIIFSFIFSHNDLPNSKIEKLSQKVSNNKLIVAIPEIALLNKTFFTSISCAFYHILISKLTEPNFLKVLDYAINELFFIDREKLVISILKKCDKFNYDIKANKKLYSFIFSNLNETIMEPFIWDYFAKYNIKLPQKVANKITQFPNPFAAVKIMPSIENIPFDLILQIIFETNDLETLELATEYDVTEIDTDVFSQKKFWIHIFRVISSSEKKISDTLLNKIVKISEKFVEKNNFYDIIESMILDNFPPTKNGIDFLKKFKSNVIFSKNNFYEKEEILYKKIIETKITPHPSFWGLLSNNFIEGIYKEDNSNIMILYGTQIDKITIKPVKNVNSQKFVIDFIQKKNIDSLVEMDEESSSFIISVLLYNNNWTKPEIKGLTKETILPFLAISLNHISSFNYNSIFPESINFSNIFLRALRFLPKSKSILLFESINSILSCQNYLFNLSIFPKEFVSQVFSLLIHQLINNIYDADKLVLLKAIFKLSKYYLNNNDIKTLFDKNIANICIFIIQNRSKIINFDSLSNIEFNNDVFKLKQISNHLFKKLDNSSDYNDIVNTIWFINNIYKNWPKSLTVRKISAFLNQSISKGFVEDFLILDLFIKKYNSENEMKNPTFNLTFLNKVVYTILQNPTPNSNDCFLNILLNAMLTEHSIFYNYSIIYFEDKCINQQMNIYTDFKQLSNTVFNSIFEYKSYNYIRKANCVYFNLPSKFGSSIISILFSEANKQTGNYQAFFCLQHIAFSFPFLFSNNPLELFKVVLPALDYFILLFNYKNSDLNPTIINNMKASISALYCLFFTLHSTKVLDSFIPWIYKNICSFSHSQIFAFSFILNSLFSTKEVNNVMLSLSSKHNFPEIAYKLLKMDVDESIYKIYKSNILNILTLYYQTMNQLFSTQTIIYIDELKKIKKPFYHSFNQCSTIYPQKLQPLNFPIPDIIEIKNYIYNNSDSNNFWLLNDQNSYITHPEKKDQKTVTHFKIQNFYIDTPIVETINEIRFLARQQKWIYKYIVNSEKFQLCQDHYNELMKVIKKLKKLPTINDDNEMKLKYNEVDTDYFFSEDLCQINLFNFLIKEAFLNDNIKDVEKLFLLINAIVKNKRAFISFSNALFDYIDQHSNEANKIINIISNFQKTNINDFNKSNFFQDIGNKLIDLALSKGFKTNVKFLSWISDLLIIFDDLPDNVIHLICFMIISDPFNYNIEKLCKKMHDNNNIKIVQQFLINLISKKPYTRYYTIFCSTIGSNKLNLKIELSTALRIIDEAICEYNKNSIKLNTTLDFVFILFNMAVPNKPENIENISSESSESMLKRAHPDLIETNPIFWDFYEKNLKFFNSILENDVIYFEKLSSLKEYYELYDFKKRFLDFREKMTKRIKTEKTMKIQVDRSEILPQSFTFLKNKTCKDWLSEMNITFIGENGIDVGGLRKNWFTLVIKELLNPNLALFLSTENQTYQPNPLSEINPEHIEFFKFAGMFIARTIIQGHYVNAHFTRSFYRQILQTKVKFSDFEDIDENIYKSFQTILKEDVEPLGLNFTIDVDELGVIKTVLLKENGDKIDVTNENKTEFVDLYVDYRLRKSILKQINAFCEGFYSLIPFEEIKFFTPKELDLIICGNRIFDVVDLKNNTIFVHPYSSNHPVINLFFNALSKWNSDDLSKFLMFVTGSSQVPINGFKEYKIKIAPGGDRNRLCVAHTCFNILDLPEYENEEELNRKLLQSIQECHFLLR